MKKTLILFFTFLCLAPGLHAQVFDTMDTNYGMTPGSDGSATNLHALVIPAPSNQGIQLWYNLTSSGAYAQVLKDYSKLDLSAMYWPENKFRFWFRGNGPANTFTIALTDSDGDIAYYKIIGGMNNRLWQKVELARTDFSFDNSKAGRFDWYRVAKYETKAEKTLEGGNGTLDVDSIEIIQSQKDAANKVLDNFNSGVGGPNGFGGTPGTFEGGGGVQSTSTFRQSSETDPANVYEGAASLKISYNFDYTTQTTLGYYSTPGGADLSQYRQIEFYAKCSNENNSFSIVYGSSSINQQVVKVGGITTAWKKFTIPLLDYDTAFRDGNGAASVTEFVIQITKNQSETSGTFWVDDVRYVRPALESQVLKNIDQADETSTSWGPFNDAGGSSAVSIVEDGVSGKAVRVTYDFGPGNYVGMYREGYLNLSPFDGARFLFNYRNLSTNKLVLSLVDSGNVRFYRTINGITDTGTEWKTANFQFKDFVAADTNARTLDLKKIKEVRFTIEKDKGGSGKLGLDQFEVLNLPKSEVKGDTSRLIQTFSIDNNPVSPNGDGVKDSAVFSYSIGEDSYMRLRIYDQRGAVVREIKKTAPDTAGANTILWDCMTDTEGLVRNGLYYFQLTAESVSSERKGSVTNVIAVLR